MKKTQRLKIASLVGLMLFALILANGQSVDMRARLALALEAIATAFGGSVEAQSTDMDARAALAAEEIQANLGGVTGVSFTPTNYTASATNAEGHLIGVDVALGAVVSAGVADGDKGDVTVSSSGTVWTLDAVYQPTNGYLTDLAADGIITNLAGRTLAVTATAGSEGVVAAIRRATGQTNDILQIQDASNGYLAGFASNGVLRAPGIILGTNTVITNWNVGTGDFLADGSVPMTGPLDAGGNAVTNLDSEAYDATGWNGDTSAPSKDAVRDKIETMSAGSGDDVWVNGSNVTHPDFDNTASSGTVTPTTFSVSGTNVTLTIGNAGATAAGAVTTGTQTFAGDKTFSGSVTVEGSLILSGSGGGGMDSLQVTNKFTNSVLTATRVVYAGSDEALTDDAGLTYDGATDTLTSGAFVAGATNVISALAGKQATLTDSSGLRGALSDESGTGIALFDGATLALNLASTMNTSVSNVINLDLASSQIAVGGNIAYIHATNGAAGTYKTHVAVFPNWSGGNVTLTIPSGWKTNVYSAVPANLTNGTITKMYVSAHAATGDSANQTNVTVSFEYFK